MSRRSCLVALPVLLVATLGACASPRSVASRAPQSDDLAAPELGVPDEDEGRSLTTSLLLYLPNRVFDVFDIVRAGVDVGPGVGASAQVTSAARAAYMSRISVGVGLQTLRHLPVKAAADAELGAGPLGGDVGPGLGWYRSPADIRLEVHPLVAGAHVAVEPLEIIDLVTGLFGFDPSDDDF